MLKKMLFLLLFFCIAAQSTAAAELRFKQPSLKQLKHIYDIFEYHGEKDYLMLPDYQYPAILLSHFPSDYHTLTDEQERNALFIKILAPLALRINQEIKAQRKQLLDMQTKFAKQEKLTAKETALLEKLAQKYDVFTRLKGNERIEFLLNELIIKIDIIPPSLLITAAALETNWGTSRIIKEGNSLYKKLVWHTDKGLKPVGETEDSSYRIKTYPDIYASMQEFALSLNSDIKYQDMREMRYKILLRGSRLLGTNLAPYMLWNSPLKNYAGLFQYTLAYYELNIIDKSSLDSTISQDRLPDNLKKLLTP